MKFACVICTSPFQDEDRIVATLCGHVYHDSCIRSWSVRSANGIPSCPSCRKPYICNQLITLYLDFGLNDTRNMFSESMVSQLILDAVQNKEPTSPSPGDRTMLFHHDQEEAIRASIHDQYKEEILELQEENNYLRAQMTSIEESLKGPQHPVKVKVEITGEHSNSEKQGVI